MNINNHYPNFTHSLSSRSTAVIPSDDILPHPARSVRPA